MLKMHDRQISSSNENSTAEKKRNDLMVTRRNDAVYVSNFDISRELKS